MNLKEIDIYFLTSSPSYLAFALFPSPYLIYHELTPVSCHPNENEPQSFMFETMVIVLIMIIIIIIKEEANQGEREKKKKKGRDRLKPTWREPWNFGTIFLQQTHQEYDDSTWLPIKSLLTQQELLRMLYWSLSFNPLTRGKEILFSQLRILLYVAAMQFPRA